ncbi:MAG: M20/M25/M40 family metallo-hydrolase [Deltaproteobacteria bacterium]|nr:M20/M25/M40 family metallo-hydrolase [Deltaproteobacteria bacterium]
MRCLALASLLISPSLLAISCAAAKPMPQSQQAAPVHALFTQTLEPRLVPLLQEVLRFPTITKAVDAHAAQKAWLLRVGTELGLTVRDAGLITEIELPGPPGAPVLGLMVHGDVQRAEGPWTHPPFAGDVSDGKVWGRGAADDKGPLVQALLAMKALADAGPKRTQTVRLLVGSDEESTNLDVKTYLTTHAAPDYTLVLDANFPATVGEKAWVGLTVSAPAEASLRAGADKFPYEIASLKAGLGPSIVPDSAEIVLRWRTGAPLWELLVAKLRAKTPDEGTKVFLEPLGEVPQANTPSPFADSFSGARALRVRTTGKAAHSGVNPDGGRNALVSLAHLLDGELPPSPQDDLLAFARLAGEPEGRGLGLTRSIPLWGRSTINVGTISKHDELAAKGHELDDSLTINIRATLAETDLPALKQRMIALVDDFNHRTGAHLVFGEGYWTDTQFVVPEGAPIVPRLMGAWQRVTHRDDPPGISGGGTYAKRLPHALAFGMWFPDKPYTGHDVDEFNPIADLSLGTHVLIEALVDLACNEPLTEPFGARVEAK